LIRRAINEGVAKKLIDRYKWWEWYCRGIEAMDNNPAPGNKAGGITTVFEKSLGGVTKGGTTPMMDVFLYGEPITTRGFVFMDTPGHDPVSITGLVAGGCNLICFTTGRGSVFGCKPVPSIKLATNSLMYRHMAEDMDINCGVVLEGTPIATVGRQIFEEMIAVASGKRSKSELSGVGEEEFAPWIIGPVMCARAPERALGHVRLLGDGGRRRRPRLERVGDVASRGGARQVRQGGVGEGEVRVRRGRQ